MAQDGTGHIGQQLCQTRAFLPSNSRGCQRLPHIRQAAQEGHLQALQMVAQALARPRAPTISVAASASPAAASRASGCAQGAGGRSSARCQQELSPLPCSCASRLRSSRSNAAAQLPGKAAGFSAPAGYRRQTAPGRPPPLAEATGKPLPPWSVNSNASGAGGKAPAQPPGFSAPPPAALGACARNSAQLLRRLAEGPAAALHALGLLRAPEPPSLQEGETEGEGQEDRVGEGEEQTWSQLQWLVAQDPHLKLP